MSFRNFLCLTVLTGVLNALIFSPYKDVTINMDWNTNVLSTSVTGSRQQVLSVLPSSGADTITWAFATGSCGSESWGGINGTALADANVKSWLSSGKKYIISTGGASGSFKCTSDGDFETFINRYYTDAMIGVDFDIEQGMGQDDITSLVQRIQNVQNKFSHLRFSFTLACFGGDANPILGDLGIKTLSAINSVGLKDYYINLMVMDFGTTNSNNCVVSGDHCDMGQSAIKAATSLNAQYGVPFERIELTPMIGGNDAVDETFDLGDVDEVTSFALQKNLGGVHHWSFDRDADCAAGYASPTCNSYGQAGTLGFTQKFARNLNIAPSPTPVVPNAQPVLSPQAVPTPQPPAPTPQVPTANMCAQTGCHGCLWIYATGNTCYPDYPKESCDVYADQGYQWCP